MSVSYSVYLKNQTEFQLYRTCQNCSLVLSLQTYSNLDSVINELKSRVCVPCCRDGSFEYPPWRLYSVRWIHPKIVSKLINPDPYDLDTCTCQQLALNHIKWDKWIPMACNLCGGYCFYVNNESSSQRVQLHNLVDLLTIETELLSFFGIKDIWPKVNLMDLRAKDCDVSNVAKSLGRPKNKVD